MKALFLFFILFILFIYGVTGSLFSGGPNIYFNDVKSAIEAYEKTQDSSSNIDYLDAIIFTVEMKNGFPKDFYRFKELPIPIKLIFNFEDVDLQAKINYPPAKDLPRKLDGISLDEIPKKEIRKAINFDKICTYVQVEELELSLSEGANSLPDCIGKMFNLRNISVSNRYESSRLEHLPATYIDLINLEYISFNLPKQVSGIKKYTDTYEEIPEEVQKIITMNGRDLNSFLYPMSSNYFLYSRAYWPKKVEAGLFAGPLQVPEIYYVSADAGLSVRSKPKLSSSRLGVMPLYTRVAVYEKGAEKTIDGISAPWYRIRVVVGGKLLEGWAWGAYLKQFAP